ncbi:MAG: hypothetical protein HY081_06020 [Gammaproteobacteria bacterium]|nr:hypothetical protein [Gammaproteobacteria bacterium]
MANLWNGAKIIFFKRVEAKSWAVSAEQLIVMALLAIGLGVILNRTFYSGTVVFNWNEIRGLWFDLPIFLLVGWLSARLAVTRVNPLLLPVVLFSAMLITDLVLTAAIHVGTRLLPPDKISWLWIGVYYGAFVWLIAIAAVFILRAAQLSTRRVLLTMTPLLFMGALGFLLPPQPIWYQSSDKYADLNTPKADSPVAEEMLYLQPRLAEQTIKALLPNKKGSAHLYFVGFAPYSYEDVFLKESEVIRSLMDERFGTHGRSLLLVNNNKTLRRYPLATVTNLRESLQHIGAVIDTQNDVVVVYLTSHGSKKHRLSNDYWPLQLEELDPTLLKQLLDEAKIKWRVVIVSACYAGGFIEPLRGPTTLVMTASDATHTSFGCGAESDFTYFAKALFDEQLRQTYSFETAFQRAVPIIRAREKEKREEFSNPQIAMGEAIRARLEQIERRLAAAAKISAAPKLREAKN